MENINIVRNLFFSFSLKPLLDSASLWLGDTNILPIDFIYLMDEEKAAAIISPGDILPFDDWRGKITSPEDIYKVDLMKEIKKIE